jgi:hypothetical protein
VHLLDRKFGSHAATETAVHTRWSSRWSFRRPQ